eukprot:6040943-Amphidinium_carterae.1
MERFSCTLPLEEDDRPFILTRLRQTLIQLLSITNQLTCPQDQADLGAYQSRGSSPKPSCSCSFYQIGSENDSESEESDVFEYSHWGSIGWERLTPGEYESEYD